jgi:(R,R)-butanediol dehydrogenase/meso-butanediol dehydrogenase/diacetyl reductase
MAASLRAVALAAPARGSSALVIGAGMIGLGIIYFLNRLGIDRIVCVARSDERRHLATRMAAGHFLRQNERMPERVEAVLGSEPDVVFDAAGAPGIIDQAIACVRPGGTIVVASLLMAPDSVCHGLAAFKELRIQYAIAYDERQFKQAAEHVGADFATLGRLASTPVGLDEFPLEFESVRQRSDRCKVLLDPWA